MFEHYPDIMNVKQVAEALAVGKNTVYRLITQNELPSFTIGNSIKIPKQGLLTYIQHACYNADYIAHSLL